MTHEQNPKPTLYEYRYPNAVRDLELAHDMALAADNAESRINTYKFLLRDEGFAFDPTDDEDGLVKARADAEEAYRSVLEQHEQK